MLFLVLTHRYLVRLIEKDIRRHEHRIRKKAVTGINSLGNLIFEGVAPFHEPHWGNGWQYPGQFTHLGNIRLYPECAFVWVKAQSQKISCSFQGTRGKFLPVMNRGEGMQINDKNIEIRTFHVGNHGFHHSEIIANMELTGGLDTW